MEAQQSTLATKLELNTEQAIVMLSAPTTSNLFGEKPTARNGKMTRDTTAHAVQSLIFGKPISGLMHIQLILVQCQAIIDVKDLNVETALQDKMEFVIKTAVT